MSDDDIYFRDDEPVWWPKYDVRPDKCLNKVNVQIAAMDATIALCKKTDLCIQAGGHAGLWPKRLAKTFKRVLTYECEPVLFKCMTRNLAGIPNIELHSLALGPTSSLVRMMPHKSAGSWSILPDGTVPVYQTSIDHLSLDVCDAIFLDIEGYEAQALAGAERTIRQFKPILHLEVLPRSRAAIEAKVAELGYRKVNRIHGDEIFVHGG